MQFIEHFKQTPGRPLINQPCREKHSCAKASPIWLADV